MSEVTYQLIKLYDRWVIEHQQVARREAEMTRTIELFAEQIETLKGTMDTIQKEIKESSAKAAIMVVESVGKHTKRYFEESIHGASLELNQIVHRASNVMPNYEELEKSTFIKMLIIIVLVALLVGFALGSCWISRSTVSVEALRQYIYPTK